MVSMGRGRWGRSAITQMRIFRACTWQCVIGSGRPCHSLQTPLASSGTPCQDHPGKHELTQSWQQQVGLSADYTRNFRQWKITKALLLTAEPLVPSAHARTLTYTLSHTLSHSHTLSLSLLFFSGRILRKMS